RLDHGPTKMPAKMPARTTRQSGRPLPAASPAARGRRPKGSAMVVRANDRAILNRSCLFLLFAQPIVPKGTQTRECFHILLPVGRGFTGDHIVNVADGKSLHFDTAHPGIFKSFDAIRREYQINIKRAILELDEVLSSLNVRDLRIAKRESEISKGANQGDSPRTNAGSLPSCRNFEKKHRQERACRCGQRRNEGGSLTVAAGPLRILLAIPEEYPRIPASSDRIASSSYRDVPWMTPV